MLDNEFKYFKKNLSELYKKYPNRYIVVQGEQVEFDGETFEDALTLATSNNLELGTFLIQLCGKDSSCYTQVFYSPRVKFA